MLLRSAAQRSQPLLQHCSCNPAPAACSCRRQRLMHELSGIAQCTRNSREAASPGKLELSPCSTDSAFLEATVQG